METKTSQIFRNYVDLKDVDIAPKDMHFNQIVEFIHRMVNIFVHHELVAKKSTCKLRRCEESICIFVIYSIFGVRLIVQLFGGGKTDWNTPTWFAEFNILTKRI
jgi:hypothetical protein